MRCGKIFASIDEKYGRIDNRNKQCGVAPAILLETSYEVIGDKVNQYRTFMCVKGAKMMVEKGISGVIINMGLISEK
ncbi:MAG: hypothetical protein ACLTK0_06570 [Anaerovoracaceae bacterium]